MAIIETPYLRAFMRSHGASCFRPRVILRTCLTGQSFLYCNTISLKNMFIQVLVNPSALAARLLRGLFMGACMLAALALLALATSTANLPLALALAAGGLALGAIAPAD